MFPKIFTSLLGASVGVLLLSPLAYAQEAGSTTTTTTTTLEATTQTQPPVKKSTKRVTKKSTAKPAVAPAPQPATTATTYQSTTTTTEVKPPPPKEIAYKVYDEDMLKKMSKNLCSPGFKAYVGGDDKNVCKTKASAPDIAYSCVWDKDGPPAFAASKQGPCNLDYTQHQGTVTIKKDTFKDDPPLSYGVEAQCCFRPAKGYETTALSQ